MEKHNLKIEDSEKIEEKKWERLRARLSKMLLKAVPKSVADELVTQRLRGVEEILFYILKRYQPGGVAEKNSLLQSVEKVNRQTTARGMSDEILQWHLKMNRVVALNITPPDISRLVAEWTSAIDALLKVLQNEALTFRCQTIRLQLWLDTQPSNEGLKSFLDHTQAELSAIALVEPTNVLTPPQVNQVNGKGNNKGQQKDKTKDANKPKDGKETKEAEKPSPKGQGKDSA
jgi:hypothetical protein